MEVFLDHSVAPLGDSDINTRISQALALPLTGLSRAAVEDSYLRSWKWSRNATQAALRYAAESSDPAVAAEAQRIAARHNGVWRAANKLVKQHNGKEVRAVSAVRADAGDSTCPTFLERQGRKRLQEIGPVLEAARMSGYTLMRGDSLSMPRHRAQALLAGMRIKSVRAAVGIVGADILVIPDSDSTVQVKMIVAFDAATVDTKEIDFGGIHIKFTPCLDYGIFYDKPYEACKRLGVDAWIASQLARFVNGERQRDRVTLGIFYGEAAAELVKSAFHAESSSWGAVDNLHAAAVFGQIEDALAIVKEASSQGDLSAAQIALSYARAYAADAVNVFGSSPIAMARFNLAANFDLSGIDASPIRKDVHLSLMSMISQLSKPLERVASEWVCIEHVKVHSPADIAALAKWMREG